MTEKIRVLFVDDEPMVLSGLRRSLRSRRDEWDAVFTESGAEALDRLAEGPFEAVVSDMRMPGMDGAELLRRVREIQPGAVRLILSGHSEQEAVDHAMGVAHHFLWKPCEAEHLQNVVDRMVHLAKDLDANTVRDLVGPVQNLPISPNVYVKLLEAMQDEDAGIVELATIVEEDAGLASQVLRLTNSGFFALRRTATTVQEAISFLGVGTLRHVVLEAELFEGVAATLPAELSPARLQAHSRGVAALAKAIVSDTKLRDQAFVAGLLHDVGKLVLAVRAPEAFAEALSTMQPDETPVDAETRVLGVCHAQVGAFVLGLWGLPSVVIEPVARHHEATALAGEAFDLTQAVYAANALIHWAERDTTDSDDPTAPLSEEYAARYQLEELLPEWLQLSREITAPAEAPV